jgi:hypothetical protein
MGRVIAVRLAVASLVAVVTLDAPIHARELAAVASASVASATWTAELTPGKPTVQILPDWQRTPFPVRIVGESDAPTLEDLIGTGVFQARYGFMLQQSARDEALDGTLCAPVPIGSAIGLLLSGLAALALWRAFPSAALRAQSGVSCSRVFFGVRLAHIALPTKPTGVSRG